MKERLRLAWLALTGRLSGGIYISPLNEKARVVIDSCHIESRVGQVPMIQMPPDWPSSNEESE